MSRRKPFRFRQFSVADDRCAMKVGTDGVLLGAWCRVAGKRNALDIGAGSGLIALMLAQRNPDVRVTALELEEAASAQASENAGRSPWANRVDVIHGDWNAYWKTTGQRYDLLVCNPPFYSAGGHLHADEPARRNARAEGTLSLIALFAGAGKILSDVGRLNLILPFYRRQEALEVARDTGLHATRETRVHAIAGKPAHRVLLEFGLGSGTAERTSLVVQRSAVRHDYTPAYVKLTRDFYTMLADAPDPAERA